ncbi:MAG: chlorophyll synthesis pathway protein BchC [Pseudomonadota bacterium]
MQASAIVFQNPRTLSVQALELRDRAEHDLEVEVAFSGISTGTERLLWDGSMPAFPGMGYPLVPGYETVGRVVRSGADSSFQAGDTVFVPGSTCLQGVHSLFGGAASRLIVPESRVVKVSAGLGASAVLLALAATAFHSFPKAIAPGAPFGPELIIGHGVMGRLLARLTIAMGSAAPTVWDTTQSRRSGAQGYPVIHPDADTRKDYAAIYDVSGDAGILDSVIPRLKSGGEVVLAGFYKQPLSFAYPPAFMREARIRVAAEWKREDLLAVADLVRSGRLSLDGLITHTQGLGQAREAYEVAFSDPECLKMVLDWRH